MEPLLPPSAVAHLLGVAPPTLRSWDRRYGIGATGRSPGGHRRYTPEDLRRLTDMCRMVAEGMTPADAAARAASGPASEPAAAPGVPAQRGPASGTERSASAALHGVTHAAIRMDAATVEDVLEDRLRTRGVVDTWDEVARPVLFGMGSAWAATQRFVEVEHMLSWSISSSLRRAHRSPRIPDRRHVLLACTPEELHTLPLEALAAALSENGVAWRMIGAAAPIAAIEAAVRRTAPKAVVVWSHRPESADPEALCAVRRASAGPRESTLLMTAGLGWRTGVGGMSDACATTLPDALSILTKDIAAAT
ncbi:MerR family transcriptional regulator [Nocardiopsis halophila]|uniref:MerR family transcriptional regulator n=1 Tax=Nocardiopsis halophila TaxID=141692 RepID=UPI00034D9A5E|nr:MerR family transcriptional regulator [Nocardiopsis halophila]